jgi:hypothetical protein
VTVAAFAPSLDGYLRCEDTTVPGNAQNGTGNQGITVDTTAGDILVGQQVASSYDVWQSFLAFDTSTIPASATVTAVTLSLWVDVDLSTQDFTLNVEAFDFGATIASADWRTTQGTVIGSVATAGISTSAYTVISLTTGSVQLAGTTRLCLQSSRCHGNAPTGAEYLVLFSVEATGTANDPVLTVTYTTAGQSQMVV